MAKPYLFRTYKNLHLSKNPRERTLDRNPAMAHDIPIWQVARATSAAPTYFKPPNIDGLEYLDGGFGNTNNPSVEIYNEVRTMNNNAKESASIVISVGTGKNNKISRFTKGNKPGSRFFNYLNFAKKWASESETQHEAMIREQRKFGFMRYYRLNVEEGLDEMKLDEWRTRGRARVALGRCVGKARARLGAHHKRTNSSGSMDSRELGEKAKNDATTDSTRSGSRVESLTALDVRIPAWLRPRNKTVESIAEHTKKYLEDSEVQQTIKECANILVEGRRQRARNDPQRWEKACFGAWYQCTTDGCPRGEKEYRNREDLEWHLLDKHRDQFRAESEEDRPKLEKALDEFKIIVH